jgi:hypothetical protein
MRPITPLTGIYVKLRSPPCRPPENGGCLAAALRHRPSAVQAGIAPGSAPALRHKPCGLACERLVELPLRATLEDPGYLGQRVTTPGVVVNDAAARKRARDEAGHRQPRRSVTGRELPSA